MTSGRAAADASSQVDGPFHQRTPYFWPGPEHGISTTVELTVFVMPNFGPGMPGLSISGESIGAARHALGSGPRGGHNSAGNIRITRATSAARPMTIAGRRFCTTQCTIRSRTPPIPAMGATDDRMSFSVPPTAWPLGPMLDPNSKYRDCTAQYTLDGRPPILPLKQTEKHPRPLAITALIGLQNRGLGVRVPPLLPLPGLKIRWAASGVGGFRGSRRVRPDTRSLDAVRRRQ